MAGLQSGEGRIMIDSVVWAQYINMTDTQTAASCGKNNDWHFLLWHVQIVIIGVCIFILSINRDKTIIMQEFAFV